MSDKNISMFSNACALFINDNIIIPIVNHLNSKGIIITADELNSVLQMPNTKAQSSTPLMNYGSGIIPNVSSSNSKKAIIQNNGKTCTYNYKRGENKGKLCGKSTLNGADYCSSCLKRKNINKAAEVSGIAPDEGILSFNNEEDLGTLTVNEYNKERQLYIVPVHNFIVKQEENTIYVIGKDVNGNLELLTQSEKNIALKLGLVINENSTIDNFNTENKPQQQISIVQEMSKTSNLPNNIPSIPTIQAIPSIPTIQAIPSIPTIQAIPSIPTIQAIPSIPTIQAIPSIPSMQK